MDVWDIVTCGLLWIMLLWIFAYKLLCAQMFLILSDIYIGVELLGHRVTEFNIYRNYQTTFPKWMSQFTFPSALHKGSNFSISSPTLVILCLFYYRHLSCCKVVSHCGLHLHFPDGNDVDIFHVLISHLYVFFGEMSIQILCPHFVFLLLSCTRDKAFKNNWNHHYIFVKNCKYFFPVCCFHIFCPWRILSF